MPAHNGHRTFLAEEVKALRGDFTDLAEKLSGVDNRVVGQTVALSTLIEDSKRAREHRDKLWEAINAMRAEQGQVQLAQAGIPGSIDRLAAAVESQSKKLAEIETERQQAKGAWNLATASARLAWGIVGGIVIAIAGFAAWIWKIVASMPPGVKLPPPGAGP